MLIAIFLASFISSISEYGSSKAFESLLSKNSVKEVKVKRNNKVILININDIVVNDIVSLNSGDIVPADGVVVSGSVFVNESCIMVSLMIHLKLLLMVGLTKIINYTEERLFLIMSV